MKVQEAEILVYRDGEPMVARGGSAMFVPVVGPYELQGKLVIGNSS
jgi:hypothetical protein